MLYKLTKLTIIAWLLYIILSYNLIKAENFQNFDLLSNNGNSTNFSKLDTITLLIAHPDDEVMFFAPTLISLDDKINHMNNKVKFNIFCFSNGDYEGLGSIRTQELQNSINLLLNNNQNSTQIHIFNHTDGMKEIWNTNEMEDQLTKILSPDDNNLILTFDQNGVSKHANHIACYETAYNYWLKNKQNTILLTLNSYNNNILLKYSGFIWQLIKIILTKWFKSIDMEKLEKMNSNFGLQHTNDANITFMNSYSQYMLAYATMLNAHKSQVVWFRFFWWWFSRFVFVNDLNIIQ